MLFLSVSTAQRQKKIFLKRITFYMFTYSNHGDTFALKMFLSLYLENQTNLISLSILNENKCIRIACKFT